MSDVDPIAVDHIDDKMDTVIKLLKEQNELLRELIRTVIENAPSSDDPASADDVAVRKVST